MHNSKKRTIKFVVGLAVGTSFLAASTPSHAAYQVPVYFINNSYSGQNIHFARNGGGQVLSVASLASGQTIIETMHEPLNGSIFTAQGIFASVPVSCQGEVDASAIDVLVSFDGGQQGSAPSCAVIQQCAIFNGNSCIPPAPVLSYFCVLPVRGYVSMTARQHGQITDSKTKVLGGLQSGPVFTLNLKDKSYVHSVATFFLDPPTNPVATCQKESYPDTVVSPQLKADSSSPTGYSCKFN